MPYSTSAVIDTGDPYASGIPEFDQRGEPYDRVLDGDGVDGERIDIGAVEYNDETNTEGPPKIVDVIISGSQSVHDEFSFSEALDFIEGFNPFSTVPVGGADTIEIVFSEWVESESEEVEKLGLYLYGNYTHMTYSDEMDCALIDFVFDEETFTARWRFDSDFDEIPDPFPADMLEIRLNQEGKYIVDHDGNRLDGEWTPPYSVDDDPPEGGWQLPSGDGVAGGLFVFRCVILTGDADLDNDVDGTDFLTWMIHFGQNGTFLEGDFDGDGDVDSDDLAIWQENYGLIFTWWDYYSC